MGGMGGKWGESGDKWREMGEWGRNRERNGEKWGEWGEMGNIKREMEGNGQNGEKNGEEWGEWGEKWRGNWERRVGINGEERGQGGVAERGVVFLRISLGEFFSSKADPQGSTPLTKSSSSGLRGSCTPHSHRGLEWDPPLEPGDPQSCRVWGQEGPGAAGAALGRLPQPGLLWEPRPSPSQRGIPSPKIPPQSPLPRLKGVLHLLQESRGRTRDRTRGFTLEKGGILGRNPRLGWDSQGRGNRG